MGKERVRVRIGGVDNPIIYLVAESDIAREVQSLPVPVRIFEYNVPKVIHNGLEGLWTWGSPSASLQESTRGSKWQSVDR